MYLKKIETTGFKSFANKTVLDFPRGVTAIVGPNGSGKSNVADAVKWVLGEQSMKSLRGKKSEDIIFTGTDKKAKMSAASVSLFLDNNDKKIPIDFDEVVITRKIFRNGDSEYLINKSKVRLGDIIDLLAKSGVSQRGYCVINQGMADSILAATPAERMVIFEEATGVRQFQIKKQQAINKLEATKRNLERVTDLLSEIEPRLTSLRRQATRAQKRGEVEEGLKSEQENLYFNVWKNLNQNNKKNQTDRENLDKLIGDASKELEQIQIKLSQNDNKNENYQPQLNKLQEDLGVFQTKLNELARNVSIIDGRIQIENERKDKIEHPEYVPINLGYVKEKLSSIISIYNRFLSLFDKKDMTDVEKIKKDSVEVRKKIEFLFAEVQSGKINYNDQKIIFDDTNFLKLEKEKQEFESKIQEFNDGHREVREKINRLNLDEQERRKLFFELERSLRIKQNELDRFKDNLNLVNIELAKFEVRKEDLINEIKEEFEGMEFLENLQNNNIQKDSDGNYFNQEECRAKIRKLKFQLEQIGGIDPLIVEEYEETQNRFEFLSAQANDLQQASDALREVIKELDRKIEEIFKGSFKKINEEFDKYFKIIFRGGKANLSIKYSENKEDKKDGEDGDENSAEDENSDIEKPEKQKRIAGIEINVTPPGKKISSLNMLSGGERALASIAVLFAIIANNPPPFSVLDEIDAALDEANSAKLSEIIGDVSKSTQFIIITHNREMMKQAGILYGVTMMDDGVSKIISLNLEDVGK
ncbi:MAG: AAA family ATPase [Candidatus Pacebacteria bacterium]|nr:AAA family ATPase [Candidatus Paceibacterota bacterium]